MIVSLITAVCAFFTAFILAEIYLPEKAENELRSELRLISEGIMLSGSSYAENAAFQDIDVMWLSPDGDVLFSNDEGLSRFAQAALKSDEYSANERLSFAKRKIICSVRSENGDVIIAGKIATPADMPLTAVITALLVFFLVVIPVSAAVSFMTSHKIIKRINAIEPDAPNKNKDLSELSPLLKKLKLQNRRISRQMEELRQSRIQFSLITENMSEGLMIADPKLNVLACNSGAVRLLDAEKNSEGQSIFSMNHSDAFRRCIQNAAGGRSSECILHTSYGECQILASPANSTDTVNGIVVFIIDVTERQQLETMRREFTSNVSHELKTPLTTIYGIADMLANGIVKPDDTISFGENIRTETERLIDLVNDIVALSKLDENSVPKENEPVDLYELASETIARLEHTSSEKNVSALLIGEHTVINGNRTILSEILYNLCDNAIKYNRENGFFQVKISHIPTKAVITVSDTGIGIPQQHIDRIFERFYRVDKSRSRKIKGTGLGLSIVKHAVMYHNGELRVESTAGKGSVFTVELPVNPPGKK